MLCFISPAIGKKVPCSVATRAASSGFISRMIMVLMPVSPRLHFTLWGFDPWRIAFFFQKSRALTDGAVLQGDLVDLIHGNISFLYKNIVFFGGCMNKFKEMRLTPLAAQKVSAPIIAESPVNIECRVVKELPLGSHTMFVAEVVNVIPVMTRRIRLKVGLPYIVLAFAVGKGVGAWYQLLYAAGK